MVQSRAQTIDDLPLDAIGEMVASVTPEAYIAYYEKAKPPKK